MPPDHGSLCTFNRLLILWFFILPASGHILPALSFQSSFRFDRINTEHGLSHNIVTRIVQDRDGFLWFGTEDGLNRYDGYSFRVYKHIPGDTTSLRSSWIRALHSGKNGSLWIGSSGLDRYDPLTDSFVRHELDRTGTFRDNAGYVHAIADDTSNGIWVGTTLGLYHLNPDGKTLRHFRHDPTNHGTLGGDMIFSLLLDSGGSLWIGGEHGVDRIDQGERVQKLSKNSPLALAIGGKPVIHIYQDRRGTLWFSVRDHGLVRFEPASGRSLLYHPTARPEHRLGSDLPFGVTEDGNGRIWVAHLSGLDLLDPSNKIVKSFRHDPKDPRSLSGNRVYAVHSDAADGLWVATAGAGISRFDSQRNRFGLFQGMSPENAFPVFSILEEDTGSVWLGLSGGLEKFDPATFATTPASSIIPDLKSSNPKDALAIFKDRDGFLWVGYREGGDLERIDVQGGTVRRYPFRNVRAIFQDRDGEMWIGFWFDGVARLDAASGRFRTYTNSPSHPDSLHGGGVWTFYQDSEGRIWMGTWGAGGKLNIFDKSSGRFSRLVRGLAQTEHNTAIDVRAISAGPDGTIWLGTWGNGLQRFDHGSGKFEYYYEHMGLANNFVKAIVFDESGSLWIGTERGLSMYDPIAGRFRNFSVDDGLQGDLFLSGSAFRGPGGRLYFGGDRGLNFFHPDSIKDDLVPPPVVITGFRIFEKEQDPLFWRGRIAELDHGQDFISFEFVGLDYTSPLRNRYSYKLEGFDRDWIEAGSRRYAAYTHLDGGNYTFRVRASNSDGVWNTEGASLQIRVQPPFWKTWWFTPGIVVVLLAATFTGFRLWFRHQLALERLRQRIASDLHDDVGTELSSIVLGSQYLAKTLPLGESDRSQIEKLGAAARNTHEMMRDIVWVLRSDNDTLADLNLKMREVAARLMTGRRHIFHAPKPDRQIRFHPETKRNLFLFYKEALNNIVRHSGATSVEINIIPLEDSVELEITDNGGGFDEQRSVTGTGLRNLRARADAMGATVSIQSNPGGERAFTCALRLRKCAIEYQIDYPIFFNQHEATSRQERARKKGRMDH